MMERRQGYSEMRADINRLFDAVTNLREQRAASDVVNDNLSIDVAQLTTAVQALQSAIDRSRGALYVIGAASGLLGALSASLFSLLNHPGPK